MTTPTGEHEGDARFLTTQWTVITRAAGSGEASRASLEQLIRGYWYPLYAFLRRSGHQHAQAEDLVQGFFAMVLERGDLAAVDRGRGRFRSWLLASLKNYDRGQVESAGAMKRGGGAPVLSLDAAEAEERFAREAGKGMTPEREFDRAWAHELLERAFERVKREYEDRGKGELYAVLRTELVPGSAGKSRAEIGELLGLREGAVKVALHRMRQRFGEALRAEVAETVVGEEELELELGELMEALGG